MTFNRLYFNRGILYQNFRQHGWLGIVYLLLLLITLPLYIGTQYRDNTEVIGSLFRANGEFHWLFAITVPVVMALFLFRYMQAGAPADLYHSLPLQRRHLLTMNMLSGYVMILVPIWITAGVTGWVSAVLGEPALTFDSSAVWMWGVTMSMISLFMFTLTVAVGMCIGQSILQGLTVYGISLIPLIFWGVFGLHLKRYLFGYPDHFFRFKIETISPISRLSSLSYAIPGWGELGIYAALTVILIILSYLLYRKRHVESATQAITFQIVKPIFRFGFMFTVVLLSGAYFSSISPGNPEEWGIAGYILGGIAGYIGAEMIIRKTWLIWSGSLVPRFAVYGIAAGLILYVPVADWNGYAANVPSKDNVNKVRIGGDQFIYVGNQTIKLDDEQFYSNSAGYIDAILALHQKIVNARQTLNDRGRNQMIADQESVTINYELKSGKILSREYTVQESSFQQEFKNMKSFEDYKAAMYGTYALDNDVRSIGIRSRLISDRAVYISDPQLIREFKTLLKSEILDQTYEDQKSHWEPFASAEVYQDYRDELSPKRVLDSPNLSSTYEIKPTYIRLIKWLKDNKVYDQLQVSEDEIASAQFIKQEMDSPGKANLVYPDSQLIDENLKGKKKVATKNKKIISELLQRQRSGYYTEQAIVYQIKLNFIKGQNVYMMLKEEDLTEDMKAILADL
ncbi:ABC transporter permease subunit [Paenibacillus sp. TSA_86.1]|uniref:ABC transporter permease subunit n=1 Tax=Paenibacillus sp. TSA_86.1 TaxID=3415649 RepID=UPI0040455F10